MGRTRSTTSYGYSRRSPYSLRSRSKRKFDYFASNSGLSNITSVEDILPKVETMDFRKDTNSKDHHTSQYDVGYLVIRRGQQFTFHLQLDRKLKDGEKVSVILTTGHTPYPSKGTLLLFKVGDSHQRFDWVMNSVVDADGRGYELNFTSSPEAIIGKYSVSVQIASDKSSKRTKQKEIFCLIFNPWSIKDDVYLEGDAEKAEYVMNETGRIWVGTRTKSHGLPWVFGQFEACALEAALYVLEISDLADIALSNPVIVSRTFSKMSNSFDDDGILHGNWSGDYSGGVEPTDWISSVDILNKYMENHKGVKYGQCWVFSGILTTLFRAVGIPARSVTNFESAHDNDGSMTIDRHWDNDDKPLADLNDSVWNFHVWNEIWCKRTDLPDGHDGWQVVDGTPQENSEGVMQCGPASVKAIKDGEVYLPHDAKFVIAEVNGDIIEWVREKTGEMTPVYKEHRSIGFNISTKAVGNSLRQDITSHYKHEEGSDMERKVASLITKFSSRKEELLKFYDVGTAKSVEFSLRGEGFTSGDVDIYLDLKSSDAKVVHIDVTLSCVATYYNGVTSDELKVDKQHVELHPGEVKCVYVKMTGQEYLNKIATDAMVAVFCKANVRETGQHYFKKETFTIDRPDVIVNIHRSVEVNTEFSVDISFTNNLDMPLTECRLILDGPGVYAVNLIKLYKSTIGPGETINQTLTFKARSVGVKEIVALLHTRQLQNITGSSTVDVI